ncbi:sterol desaturase family protein [uncultured Paraglaciecola sp.]|uniref:sterol desaturase family protein n=1 Tax=uncultured Paraglaciecola sp. TaxID=1765024 RepID=UPI0025960BC5|nr:sterol desaturase family protein [uncultured Paraglaciecola sp.]
MMIDSTTEVWIRLGVFIGVLALMMCWEALTPNRKSPVSKLARWTTNFGLIFLGSLVVRLLIPAGLGAVALWAQQHNIGLWNQFSVSLWWSIPITVVLFDCLIYWQHRLFHRVPLLWRLHRVHHADPHIDVSTGLRFHPIEIGLSIAIKLVAVVLLGAPLMAILIFEVLLNATAMFSHANIALPKNIEQLLRKVIVTQTMHRIHHSQIVSETDSNFGFNLSIWDRLFASYTQAAKNGDTGINIGLKEYPTQKSNSNLVHLLLMPFKNKPTGYK